VWELNDDWGIERVSNPLDFPDTVESLTDAMARCVLSVVTWSDDGNDDNNSHSLLDPSIVRNAILGDNLRHRRPVRRHVDAGRIGLEIDGAHTLFHPDILTESSALRHIALILAAKLSCYKHRTDPDNHSPAIPVAVYLNTVQQAISATRTLTHLQANIQLHNNEVDFEKIQIHCLGRTPCDMIPLEMRNKLAVNHSERKKRLETGYVDASRGWIIVVQPTDSNDEFRPPTPALSTVESLQELSIRAAVHGLPVIVISPRLTQQMRWIWDQSGYQQSSTYGGIEPPKGPTPWILRDFVPPVFCWISNALRINDETDEYEEEIAFRDFPDRNTCLSMWQSVLTPGHSWYVYHYRRLSKDDSNPHRNHVYMASTKNAAGRPTRTVLRRLFREFWSSQQAKTT
jgi:hypothetical protein